MQSSGETTFVRGVRRPSNQLARQGMIIYVPLGDEKDVTRKPEFYQPIAEFLTAAGISTI